MTNRQQRPLFGIQRVVLYTGLTIRTVIMINNSLKSLSFWADLFELFLQIGTYMALHEATSYNDNRKPQIENENEENFD